MNPENSISRHRTEAHEEHKGVIGFAVSGIKHYENDFYKNSPSSFAALSVTGSWCGCSCAHCNRTLLPSMHDAGTAEKLRAVIDKLADSGCKGILISGGSDQNGAVPLLPAMEGIAYAKKKKLKVVVHTGLVDRETAFALKAAKADQILLDVIGSEKTIRGVYGINRTPGDFLQSMLYCREAGLELAPHLVVGLDFGRIEGEYNAVDMVRNAGAKSFVLVVLTPRRGTKMQNISPPPLAEVVKVFSYTADTLSNTRISLGCARPFEYSIELEKAAVDLGFDAIAYPHADTIQYAASIGFETFFFEECCCIGQR